MDRSYLCHKLNQPILISGCCIFYLCPRLLHGPFLPVSQVVKLNHLDLRLSYLLPVSQVVTRTVLTCVTHCRAAIDEGCSSGTETGRSLRDEHADMGAVLVLTSVLDCNRKPIVNNTFNKYQHFLTCRYPDGNLSKAFQFQSNIYIIFLKFVQYLPNRLHYFSTSIYFIKVYVSFSSFT